jgi:hypothetical protein
VCHLYGCCSGCTYLSICTSIHICSLLTCHILLIYSLIMLFSLSLLFRNWAYNTYTYLVHFFCSIDNLLKVPCHESFEKNLSKGKSKKIFHNSIALCHFSPFTQKNGRLKFDDISACPLGWVDIGTST